MIKYIALVLIGAVLTITGFCQENVFINKRLHHAHYSRKPILNQAPSAFANETEKQKLDSIIEYNFNETTGEWDVKFRKESFGYDNAFNDTLFLLSAWDEDNNQWVNLWKEITKYDEHNNMSSYTAYTWDSNRQWEPFYKEQYMYNDKDEMAETIFYTWKYAQENWLLIEKTRHTYNADGNLLADSIYYKHNDSDKWVLAEKTEYKYTSGYLEFINSSVLNTDSTKWFPDKKEQMLYHDDEGFLYATQKFIWDETINDWKDKEVKSFGHDDDKNMNRCTKISWGADTTVLIETFDFDYTVSNNGLILPKVLNTNDRMAFHHLITKKYLRQFNKETRLREKYREVKYYYSPVEISTNIGFSNPESITVFPNPVMVTLQIRLPGYDSQISFALFDMNGKKILSKAIINGQSIDVSPLKSGIYFYIVTTKQEKVTGKLVKK